MRRRILDALIVLWMIVACIVLFDAGEAKAFPGIPCDLKCRHVFYYGGTVNGNVLIGKFEVMDCLPCAAGGCNSAAAVSAGSCQPTLNDQASAVVNGNIVCLDGTKELTLYQAASTDVPMQYTTSSIKQKMCQPVEPEEEPPLPGNNTRVK